MIFSKTAWLVKAKFHVEPPWEGGKKVYFNGPGHMTKMTAMPIYGKNLQKYTPTETKSYEHEAWHGELCTQFLQSLYK